MARTGGSEGRPSLRRPVPVQERVRSSWVWASGGGCAAGRMASRRRRRSSASSQSPLANRPAGSLDLLATRGPKPGRRSSECSTVAGCRVRYFTVSPPRVSLPCGLHPAPVGCRPGVAGGELRDLIRGTLTTVRMFSPAGRASGAPGSAGGTRSGNRTGQQAQCLQTGRSGRPLAKGKRRCAHR